MDGYLDLPGVGRIRVATTADLDRAKERLALARTPAQPQRVLTASASKIQAGESAYAKRMGMEWQHRALSYYDMIGELRYASHFYARQLSRVRYYPALQQPNGTTKEITEGLPVDLLNRIQDPGGGRSQLQYNYGRLMFVTGEGVLFGSRLGRPDERWRFLWKEEVKLRGDSAERVKTGGESYDPPEIGVGYRLWNPHPRHSDDPDSPLRAIMDIAEELLLLTASVHSTAVSRMTKGVIIVPLEAVPQDPATEVVGMDEDPENNVFLDSYIEHVTGQTEDPGSPEAQVPFLYTPPYDFADRVRWMQTHDPQNDYLERELRTEAIKRMALGLDMPPEALLGMTDANHWCQDEDTEILAKGRGWISNRDLSVGDEVLTLNHESGLSEWQPVEDIYRAEVEGEVMYRMESRSHSSLSTPQHRWPIIKTGYKISGYRRRWTTSAEGFAASDRVPVAAWLREEQRGEIYDTDFVRLAVAYTADGTNLEHGNIRIVKFSVDEIVEMRRILTSLYGPDGFREHAHPTSTATGTSFVLRQAEAKELLDLCDEKRALPVSFVDALTPEQRVVLLRSCAEIGDGVYFDGGSTLYQVEPCRLNAFAYAAHLCGFKVTYGKRGQQTGFGTDPLSWVRWSCSNDTFAPSRCEHSLEVYSGTVWCPVTKNKTWFARRFGKAYYTGNTAKQVQHDIWRSHGMPKAEQFADDLAEAYLRPALEAERYPDWSDVVISYDDSQVVISPDRTEDAFKAVDRIIISRRYARELLGFSEDGAPDEEEEEFLTSVKMRQPVDIEDGELVLPQRGPIPSSNGNAPAEEGPPEPTSGRSGSRQESMSASARILGAAELALLRCRELAGIRIRHKCKDCAEGHPDAVVASVVGIEQAGEPLKLVRGGTDGLRTYLCGTGLEDAQAVSLCQTLEVYAARTLFEERQPDLPAGFIAQVEKAKEVSHALHDQ